MQEKLTSGDRVKHATKTEWGLGEVLGGEYGGRVRVLFEDVGVKEFQLDHARFVRVSGDEADSPYLTALVKSFNAEQANPKKSGKVRNGEFVSFSKAVENFLSFFPAGFQDQAYLYGAQNERQYKLAANELMHQLLGRDEFRRLLAAGQYKEIVERCKKVMNKTNLIHHYEKIWFSNGVAAEEAQKKFAEALFDMLYGNDELRIRFERFSAMLYEVNSAKWPIATYFLFVAFPEEHLFLKPEVTQNAAAVLGLEINYRPELNWLTYSRVLELAKLIKDRLAACRRDELKPSDMIDVQSFIWIVAPSYYQ